MNNKRIELLAPAGSAACALAAFDAGADAIYAGLPKFNARERGENFTVESLGKVIRYAHEKNRKVYVTMNTLIKEKELTQVAEYLAMLSEINTDALIVQDLGVIKMAKEYFPKLNLHGSTQMGIHNSNGMKVAEELGLKRVILERQVTLDELKLLCKRSSLELEIFIHGALCCSLSGQCYFSSYLGGHSGNRGKCKQPCRRRYFSKSGNGFFFSPQDLATPELIQQIKKMPISSLKIEGRLRQSDYVTETVSAYRLLLDTPDENYADAIIEARSKLSRTYGRKWSDGFLKKESFSNLIAHSTSGATGMLCGYVNDVSNKGFSMSVNKRIFMGDKIRVQPKNGEDGVALTITKMFSENMPVRKVAANSEVFICCDKEIPIGGVVYKIGSSTIDYTSRINALESPKKLLDLDVEVDFNKIKISVLNAPFADWENPLELTEAQNIAISQETIKQEFSSCDSKDFELGECNVKINGNYFFPSSLLKKIRRAFWNDLKENLIPEAVFNDSSVGLERFRKAYTKLKPSYSLPEYLTETIAMKPGGAEPANRKAIRAVNVYDFNKLTNEVILPEFCSEEHLHSLEKAIKNAYDSGIKRFRVTSLYALAMLKNFENIVINISTPLPVCNSLSVLSLEEFGAQKVMVHLELEKDAIQELLQHSPLPLEVYRHGRIPLLVTRAKIPIEGEIHDNRKNEFLVKYNNQEKLSRIFSGKIYSIPRMSGIYDYYDLTIAHWNANETETFNYETELL